MKRFKAIAAMSLNRVIGRGNQIPWRLPEDFRWFKQMTTGQVVLMGRKTFESLRKPLPNRQTIVLTRDPQRFIQVCAGRSLAVRAWPGLRPEAPVTEGGGPRFGPSPGVNADHSPASPRPTTLWVCRSLDDVDPDAVDAEVFVCGGADIYRQALPWCSDLYLTLVKREVEGDAFFPPFEDRFERCATLRETPELDILHYRNRELPPGVSPQINT
jgi:dihydrofolate reductase